MCHGELYASHWLKDEIAREILEEVDEGRRPAEGADATGERPAFLNEESEADLDVLTGGADR